MKSELVWISGFVGHDFRAIEAYLRPAGFKNILTKSVSLLSKEELLIGMNDLSDQETLRSNGMVKVVNISDQWSLKDTQNECVP